MAAEAQEAQTDRDVASIAEARAAQAGVSRHSPF
jgi:hypothetical protein